MELHDFEDKDGDASELSKIFENNASLDLKTENGSSESMAKTFLELGVKTEPVDEVGDTHLHRTVRGNYSVVVDLLLEDPVTRSAINLDALNKRGESALHIACSRGAKNIVISLLDHGARTDLVDVYGDTALHNAAIKNNLEIVNLLLSCPQNKKAIINTQNLRGQSSLHVACLKGSGEVVKILLDHGADMHLLDEDDDTALYYAVKKKHPEVVKYLLEDLMNHTVDFNIRYKAGKTVLHYASQFGLDSIVRRYLELGVKTDFVDAKGNIPLFNAVKGNHTEVAKLLLDNMSNQTIDLNIQNKRGQTLLHYACFNGMDPVVKTLLEHDVKTDAKEEDEETPLHWAVAGNHISVVKLLLGSQNQQAVDIDATDKNGQTALHRACKNGNVSIVKISATKGEISTNDGRLNSEQKSRLLQMLSIVKILLEYGAKTDLEEQSEIIWGNKYLLNSRLSRNTALDITMDLLDNLDVDEEEVKEVRLEVVALLLNTMTKNMINVNTQYKEDKTALHYASKYGLESVVKNLLELGARTDLVDEDGDTPLHEAAKENPAVVKLLLETQTKLTVDLNTPNKNGRTALHYACFYGDLDVVSILLACGAKTDVVDSWGDSPLHDASGRDYPEVVERLLGKGGININTQNKNGQTCLHVACLNGSVNVVRILLDHGAEIGLVDAKGNTPLHNAMTKNQPEIVKILPKVTADLVNNLVAISNHRAIVRYIVQEVDYDSWKHEGHLLLKSAVIRKDGETAALLKEKGVQEDDELYCSSDGTSDSEEDSDEDSDIDSDEDCGS